MKLVRRRHLKRGRRRSPLILRPDHPAMIEGRSIHPNLVQSVQPDVWALKSGEHSSKLGDRIVTGEWTGSAIYHLRLEERKTCWVGCQQRAGCYLNNEHWPRAIRWKVDAKLYTRLLIELDVLLHRNRYVAIRLHEGGDFPNVDYVGFWLSALKAHPRLRLFGFTHWPRSHPIGAAIEVESERWDRFRIRFSDNHRGERTAHVIEHGEEPKGHLCRATDERPEVTCGHCAYCINSTGEMSLRRH